VDLKATIDFLKTTQLCHNFLARELKQVAGICKIQQFKAKEQVFEDGDNKDYTNHFYIVFRGDIQVSKAYSYNGLTRTLLLNILTAGDCFGEIAMLTQCHTRTATIKCLTACEFLMIERSEFLNLYNANRKMADNLLMIYTRHLIHANNVSRFVMFSAKDATARLMYMLDFLKSKYGIPDGNAGILINLPFNNGKIAEFLSMKQQLYSRCKLSLKKNGLIDFNGRNLAIPDYSRFCAVLYGV